MKLEVDLDAFVAESDKPRFDLQGNHIRLQKNEARVSRDNSVVDDHGHPIAGHLRTREEAIFVARCINALKGVVPVPGTKEGRAIYERRKREAKVRQAEYELAKAKEALK